MFEHQPVTDGAAIETTLWDQPAALILFFALLTVEWALRKRAGLP